LTATKGGAHGDLGLAEADIAADHAGHGLGIGHVGQDGLDGALLVRRLLALEGGGEGVVVASGRSHAPGAHLRRCCSLV
jgi:hypothetical protein